MDVAKDWQAHCRWWSAFWDRSWIVASANTLPPEEREKFFGDAPSGRRLELDGGATCLRVHGQHLYIGCKRSTIWIYAHKPK